MKKYSVFEFCKDLDIVRTTYTWALVDYCRKNSIDVERVPNEKGTQHRLYMSKKSLKQFAKLWSNQRLLVYDKSTITYAARELLMRKIKELK